MSPMVGYKMSKIALLYEVKKKTEEGGKLIPGMRQEFKDNSKLWFSTLRGLNCNELALQ